MKKRFFFSCNSLQTNRSLLVNIVATINIRKPKLAKVWLKSAINSLDEVTLEVFFTANVSSAFQSIDMKSTSIYFIYMLNADTGDA